jgi:hypothetical protein
MDIFHQRAMACAIWISSVTLSYNSALAETWYCALTDDPTIPVYGQKIEAYVILDKTLTNITSERQLKDIVGKNPPDATKKAYTFTIVRNDDSFIVAETEYTWNNGLNIEVNSIDKRSGSFISVEILTWADKQKTNTRNGTCTRGVE